MMSEYWTARRANSDCRSSGSGFIAMLLIPFHGAPDRLTERDFRPRVAQVPDFPRVREPAQRRAFGQRPGNHLDLAPVTEGDRLGHFEDEALVHCPQMPDAQRPCLVQ